MPNEPLVLSTIRIDGGTQPREVIDEETVRAYADAMTAGVTLPPIDVFFDGVEYYLADGFHRYHAGKRTGRPYLIATVHKGTKRDAVLFSVGANSDHGLPRSNADKRKAVMTLLLDDEWLKWSNKEIARRCSVNPSTVDEQRAKLSLPESGSETKPKRTYRNKHGDEVQMKTDNIGKKPAQARTQSAKAALYDKLRAFAAQGMSTRQIAGKLGVSAAGLAVTLKRNGIDVPADRIVGGLRHHDANRFLEHIVMDAENLTADVNLIDFPAIDRARLGAWLTSLLASRTQLTTFIHRLQKEQQRHVKIASTGT